MSAREDGDETPKARVYELRCSNCGYSMKGTKSPMCPECYERLEPVEVVGHI